MKKRPVAIFDVDETFKPAFTIPSYLSLDLLEECYQTIPGFIDVSYIDKLHEYQEQVRSNQMKVNHFNSATIKLLLSAFAGKEKAVVESVGKSLAEKIKNHVSFFSSNVLRSLQKLNYYIIFISGSMSEVVEPLGKIWQVDACFSTKFQTGDKAKYNSERLRVADNKTRVINEHLLAMGYDWGDSLGMGDAPWDNYLSEVSLAICINPHPELYLEALINDWLVLFENYNGRFFSNDLMRARYEHWLADKITKYKKTAV